MTCNGEIRRKRNLLVRVTHHGTSRKRAVLRDDQNYGVHENTLIWFSAFTFFDSLKVKIERLIL